MNYTTNEIHEGLKVSETTALFIDAQNAYDTAKEKLLKALTALYGEEQATALYYNNYRLTISAFDAILSAGLGQSVCEHLTNLNNDMTI